MVGCNGALMGMLPWLFGAFLVDFSKTAWSWLQLPLAVCAVIVHLVIAILQVTRMVRLWFIKPDTGYHSRHPAHREGFQWPQLNIEWEGALYGRYLTVYLAR